MASTTDESALTTIFSKATHVRRVAPNTYRTFLNGNWTIGAVPHGGYVASTILRAAEEHLAARGQKHSISAHFEYLNRTEVGPAIIVIEDTKPGRSVSNIHATLYQGDLQDEAPFITAKTRKPVVAYLINTNLDEESGVTLKTEWELLPPPKPVDLTKIVSEQDPNWTSKDARIGMAQRSVAKAPHNLDFFFPRQYGRLGLEDNWLRFKSGEGWTNASLGFISDVLPIVIEGWRPTIDDDKDAPFKRDEHFWYPTLALNLDVKKALPEKGVEWLFLRTMTRQVRNGRFDLEATILDANGELVAVASHVNMVLPLARNLAKRGAGSKL
ncbi:thioesterase-like superfamily-domain-containing protein [Plectosphaerella cucumerina]|uniref:Thioesterase-like superfamily-domain-containing protein n=1 Tax=Plectosphaerella cucumerina TaxID=40658 RepID=A0A8K0WXT1_9PEZI|nr:thioesterase-like superfamily-domain-containing protein [Plectosphaerella cucumerina]